MNKKELEAFAREAAKGMKTEQDLNDFRKISMLNLIITLVIRKMSSLVRLTIAMVQ